MEIKKERRKQLQVYSQETAVDYEIRTENINGTDYLIVPVVMLVEGVHHGSGGPLLYTADELEACVNEWNGMPVTVGHPQDQEGNYISARYPGVLKSIVGQVYNPKMQGNKLTAECWIDITTLKTVSEDAFEYIKEKKALEVSTGVFTQEVGKKGEFDGEEYRAIATNITPDHLALLPGEEGACNWEDGCGIRNNKMKTKEMKTKEIKTNTKPAVIDKDALLAEFLERKAGIHLTSNEASFGNIIDSIYQQLNLMDTEVSYYYLEEVYDGYFIYCAVNRRSSEKKMYRQSYSVSTQGIVALSGDPIQVRKEVSYITMTRTNFKNKSEMKTNASKCTCTVDSLIGNERTNFTEDDRAWLSDLSQEQLNKLAPKEAEAPKPDESVANNKATEDKTPTGTDQQPVNNNRPIEEVVKEVLSKETDPIKFIDNFMPEGVKEQMKSALKMHQNRRNKLIKEIVDNSNFQEERLKKFSDEDLENMHQSLVENEENSTSFYGPLASSSLEEGDSNSDNTEEITAMLSFEDRSSKTEEKKK